MTSGRWRALGWTLSVLGMTNACRAGIWGSTPDLGVSADYNSNPALLTTPDTAETHGALLLDAPTTYVGDAFKLNIAPSFRFSNSQGYSAVDSDYEHLSVLGEFDSELSVLKASAAVNRDSSLYNAGLLNGNIGVRRDTVLADVNWDRQFSERFEIDTDVDATRVRYSVPDGVVTLTNYKYASIAPTLSWAETEQLKLTLNASVGRYNSLDGATESRSASLQPGFVDVLSELWTFSASAGYSRALDNAEGLELIGYEFGIFPVFERVDSESTQNGTVFLGNLTRKSERLTLTAIASRQLLPTGFNYLSRQTAYELSVNWQQSERVNVTGDVRHVQYQQPNTGNSSTDVNVTYALLAASWQWTPHWTVSVSATRIMESYPYQPAGTLPGSGLQNLGVRNTGFSISCKRQFDFTSFQQIRP
jgi:hypothetical protein